MQVVGRPVWDMQSMHQVSAGIKKSEQGITGWTFIRSPCAAAVWAWSYAGRHGQKEHARMQGLPVNRQQCMMHALGMDGMGLNAYW